MTFEEDDTTVVTTHSAATVRHSNVNLSSSRRRKTMADPREKKQPASTEEFVRVLPVFLRTIYQQDHGMLESVVRHLFPRLYGGATNDTIVSDFEQALQTVNAAAAAVGLDDDMEEIHVEEEESLSTFGPSPARPANGSVANSTGPNHTISVSTSEASADSEGAAPPPHNAK